MTALEPRRVSPFGYLRLLRSYTPHRSFSQYNTSFLGTRCLGIHCVPLVAFRTFVRSLRLSWHATIGITFALIIRFLRRTRPYYKRTSPQNNITERRPYQVPVLRIARSPLTLLNNTDPVLKLARYGAPFARLTPTLNIIATLKLALPQDRFFPLLHDYSYNMSRREVSGGRGCELDRNKAQPCRRRLREAGPDLFRYLSLPMKNAVGANLRTGDLHTASRVEGFRSLLGANEALSQLSYVPLLACGASKT